MKSLKILLFLFVSLFFTGCASTCMEYRSATTAARSEKNLKRAEEWGLKALESPECNPNTDALAPYFLATEVYLNQKDYIKMAEMLNIAEQRNSDQLLEKPFKLGDIPVKTIREGVEAYREQEWVNIYNRSVELIQKEKFIKAKKKITIAMLLHPKKTENYSTLSALFIKEENYKKALEILNKGLEINQSSILFEMKADILLNNYLDNNLQNIEKLYLDAIEFSDNPGPIMRKLLFVYIDMKNNQKAIDYSNELIDKYPDDPDLYYNVGVLYQRLTLDLFDPTRNKFLEVSSETDPKIIKEIYASFKLSRQYAYNSKDYFLQASDLELDDNISTNEAVSEMRKLMDQIDEIFIPSIRKTARSSNIELD